MRIGILWSWVCERQMQNRKHVFHIKCGNTSRVFIFRCPEHFSSELKGNLSSKATRAQRKPVLKGNLCSMEIGTLITRQLENIKVHTTLPIIDINALIAKTVGQASVAAQIHAACVEHGFFYIKGHGISENLQHQLIK